ncbi:MAG: biotin transporter BioY [Bacteroidota bacterium]
MLLDEFAIGGKDRFWDAPVKVFLATLLICLLAPIEINVVSALPVTFQTLVILTLAMILGPSKGGIATSLYLVMGALGLPVFAEGGAGWEKLIGPTGGFLLSFVLASFLVGKLSAGVWGKHWMGIALILFLGHILILLIGFLWLGVLIGFEGMWEKILPLLPGMGIKILLGTLIVGLANWGMKELIERNKAKNLHQ